MLDHLVWGILAAILLVCSVTIEHFFQVGIFINILQHATFVGLLAVGLSFCIIAGHMDLSIESVMAFAAMLAAWLTATRGSPLGIQLDTWLTFLIVLALRRAWSACSTPSWSSASGSTPSSSRWRPTSRSAASA